MRHCTCLGAASEPNSNPLRATMKFATCLLLVLASSGAASALTVGEHIGQATSLAGPVEKVVNLLKDLKNKLESDDEVEQKVYDKYACWCEKTSKAKAASIVEAQLQIRSMGQTILSLKGKIGTLASEISELTSDIRDNEQAQSEATALRTKENGEYASTTEESKEALAAMEKAIKAIAAGVKDDSLLQTGAATAAAKAAVKTVVEALPSSKPVNPSHIALLSEFLGEGAGVASNPQSATVVGMLKGMYETFAADLQKANEDEATSNTDYEDLINVKADEVKSNKKTKLEKKEEKAAAEATLADTQQLFDDTSAQRDADIAFFDETKTACERKHTEYDTRSGLRTNEIKAVGEALKVLSSDKSRAHFDKTINKGPPSFLQVTSETDRAERAYELVKSEAKADHSMRLAMLSVAAPIPCPRSWGSSTSTAW